MYAQEFLHVDENLINMTGIIYELRLKSKDVKVKNTRKSIKLNLCMQIFRQTNLRQNILIRKSVGFADCRSPKTTSSKQLDEFLQTRNILIALLQ